MFFKIVFLKKFANFTGKHLCRSLFNKFAGPQLQLYWKETLVKSAKFLRTPYFTEHLQWLLSIVSGFQPATLLKKRFRQKCFSVNFAKFLRTSFDRTPPHDCFFYLWILKSFSEHLFYRAPLRNCLFHVQVTEFQPADTVKNYFTATFQAFYTRTRSTHSKAFSYLKSLKIICEEVNS